MSARLRIAFDGRTLGSPARGVRRYVWELYSAIALEDEVECLAVGVGPDDPVPAGVAPVPSRFQPRSNLAWSAAVLPAIARRLAFDVFHAPAYTAPLFGVGPTLLTVHDVSYATQPAWYPYRRDPLRRAFYRRSITAADAVVTDAEFTRGEIERAYGIPRDTIRVVPLGVGAPFTTPAPARMPADPPFVLAVGDIHPRRNLEILVRAIAGVRRTRPAHRTLTLRVVGTDRGGVAPLVAAAASEGVPDCLQLAGNVSDADLVALYRTASVVAYPSRYEGFGLPLLEAMASGAPVIASRASAVPQTVGDAALLVDPLDLAGWTRAVADVLDDPALAHRLSDAGVRRARSYSWQRTATETLALLRATAMRRRPR